ncbi:hypothetical protein [Streptomyces sp. NPDC051994]|uniref:hypothetical protein n=1 Tax=unclassified Streptomyces TaxID=2593676 RepID=UPI003426BF0E
MLRTAGTKGIAALAAVSLALGLALSGFGIARDDLARTVAGSCLMTTALLLSALLAIRRWIINAQVERYALSRSLRDTDDERARYMAAQAALEMERQRILRDAAAEREQSLVRLKAARAAMREQFEGERARLICQSLETAFELVQSGRMNPRRDASHAKIIDFPEQVQQAAQRESARPRERDATRP